MFMLEYKTKAWWYWLASTSCLWLTVLNIYPAFISALVIAIIQLLHFFVEEKMRLTMKVQIRLGYLLALLLTMPPALHWMLWIPAIGTLARVLFSYCIMARMLVLLPVNRTVAFTWSYVKKAFFTPPRLATPLHGIPQAIH